MGPTHSEDPGHPDSKASAPTRQSQSVCWVSWFDLSQHEPPYPAERPWKQKLHRMQQRCYLLSSIDPLASAGWWTLPQVLRSLARPSHWLARFHLSPPPGSFVPTDGRTAVVQSGWKDESPLQSAGLNPIASKSSPVPGWLLAGDWHNRCPPKNLSRSHLWLPVWSTAMLACWSSSSIGCLGSHTLSLGLWLGSLSVGALWHTPLYLMGQCWPLLAPWVEVV